MCPPAVAATESSPAADAVVRRLNLEKFKDGLDVAAPWMHLQPPPERPPHL